MHTAGKPEILTFFPHKYFKKYVRGFSVILNYFLIFVKYCGMIEIFADLVKQTSSGPNASMLGFSDFLQTPINILDIT